MRQYPRAVAVALAAMLFSSTGRAVDLDPGDILVGNASYQGVVHIDPTTGDRTVISGCVDQSCSSVVGNGPFDQAFRTRSVAIAAMMAIIACRSCSSAAFGFRR